MTRYLSFFALFLVFLSYSVHSQGLPLKLFKSQDLPVGLAIGTPVVLDFNNDGYKDVALAQVFLPLTDGSFVIYFADKDGNLTKGSRKPTVTSSSLLLTSRIIGGYFNDDPHADIALLMNDTSVWISFGNGDGSFQQFKLIYPPQQKQHYMDAPYFMHFEGVDFNQDGKDEIILARGMMGMTTGWRTDGIRLLEYDPKNGWYSQDNAYIHNVTGVAKGKINTDKHYDYVIIDKVNGTRLWDSYSYTGTHKLSNLAWFTNVNDPRSIASGDLNDDGFDDIVIGNVKGNLSVIDFSNSCWTEKAVLKEVSNEDIVFSIKIADFDSDGLNDIAAVGTNSTTKTTTLYFYKRTGAFTFNPALTLQLPYVDVDKDGTNYNFITWTDYNNDGNMDFVSSFVNPQTQRVNISVYLSTGNFRYGVRELTDPRIDTKNVRVFTSGESPHMGNKNFSIGVTGLPPNSNAILMWSDKLVPQAFPMYGLPKVISILAPMKFFPANADSSGNIYMWLPVPEEKDLLHTKHYFQFIVFDGIDVFTLPALEIVLWKKFIK